jgi:beta-lactamase regulating signal transducer with metallopeptidase domain
MLAVLHGPQRAALLAHERSHLAHRHHLWIQAAEVSAAANPLLRRLPTQVRSATEQEADLDAVDVVGDRGVLMAAIASAALARRRHGAPVPVAPWPAATGADVVERVRLLREDVAPRGRTSAVAAAAVGVLIVAGVVSTLASASLTDAHYDRAELLARAVVSAPR